MDNITPEPRYIKKPQTLLRSYRGFKYRQLGQLQLASTMGKDWNLGVTFVEKWSTLPDTKADLTGRTIIITGGNVGLGFANAESFLQMNPARLILAVRSLDKGEQAKKQLLAKARTKGTVIDVWALDLSDFSSVNTFAKRMEKELDRLDIFVENAGVNTGTWTMTKDGHELT